jgi:hypothetical protein
MTNDLSKINEGIVSQRNLPVVTGYIRQIQISVTDLEIHLCSSYEKYCFWVYKYDNIVGGH